MQAMLTVPHDLAVESRTNCGLSLTPKEIHITKMSNLETIQPKRMAPMAIKAF